MVTDTTGEILQEQAIGLEALLQRMVRRFIALDLSHPATALPIAQLRVCSLLQNGPWTISAMSEELGISVSAVTQNADRLERSGLIERVSETDDRRMKKLLLTPLGMELMRSRREIRVQRALTALDQLPAETRENVLSALNALLDTSPLAAPENISDRQRL